MNKQRGSANLHSSQAVDIYLPRFSTHPCTPVFKPQPFDVTNLASTRQNFMFGVTNLHNNRNYRSWRTT